MSTDKIYVINSKTSSNNGKICKIVSTKSKEYYRVQLRNGSYINISKNSLLRASKYDIIRNISNNEIKSLVNNKKLSNRIFRKVLLKFLSDFTFLE